MTAQTTIRFDTPRLARLFAASARRRGYPVHQDGNEVTIQGVRPHEAHALVKAWALHRGALPNYLIVDWKP